jgi:hypothetical protein
MTPQKKIYFIIAAWRVLNKGEKFVQSWKVGNQICDFKFPKSYHYGNRCKDNLSIYAYNVIYFENIDMAGIATEKLSPPLPLY